MSLTRRAVVAVGAALVVLVGIGGTPGWQLARGGGVVPAVAIATRALHAGGGGAAAAALAVGFAGVVVGAGIGVPHAVKQGLTLRSAAGVTALGAGLGLAAWGTYALLWRGHRWRRLLVVPVVFVGLELLIPLASALYATNVPRPALGAATPADHGLAYDDIELHTDDGKTLAAWYLPSRNDAAVVLLHGAGSTRTSVLDHAAVLAAHGYGVLMLDSRGHGASGGTAMDFGWYGNLDVGAAVDFLAERDEVDTAKIGAVGMSMGGEQAVTAAAADDRIAAVVAEGATRRTYADSVSLPSGVQGQLHRALDWLQYTTADVVSGATPPIALPEAVAEVAPRPLLLVAGAEGDEIDVARYYRDVAVDSVTVWELPDTPHTDGLKRHPHQWEARIVGFLDNALEPAARP